LFLPPRPDQLQWDSGVFPGVKATGSEPDRSSPSGGEAKNVWSYTSAFTIHLHVVALNKHRNNFTLIFTQ